MNTKLKALALGLTLASLTAAPVSAAEWEGEARDAWIDGKLEGSYLLNTELNNFRIDTAVNGGVVTLTGMVGSEVQKDLAEEIAVNLDGVTSVNNMLTVGESDYSLDEAGRKFTNAFYDMTTTARIKSNFAMNSQLSALDINIDTKDGVVTLQGQAESDAAKQLAEEIAAGYDHVVRVDNRLVVSR